MLFTQPLDTQTHGLTRTQKDQSPCITFLLAVSVDFQPQVQRVRFNDFILSDQPWADRTERIEAFAFVPNAGPAALLQR